jgi:hypothetical protein
MTPTPEACLELARYIKDLLHGGHLDGLSADQVTLLENLLDAAWPGWEDAT